MKILVLTETDDCCGPMAAAFLNDFSTHIEAVSAGKNPLQSVEPMMITAMKECLIDLSDYVPRNVSSIEKSEFDVVYECPDLPCPKMLDECRVLRDFIKNEAFLFFKRMHAVRPYNTYSY